MCIRDSRLTVHPKQDMESVTVAGMTLKNLHAGKDLDVYKRQDQNIYVQGWLNDFQGSDVLPGQHKRVEVLEEVETEYVTATHVLITMEDDYKYRYRDGYLFECGSGVGYLCLFKTPESR